jgi:hypothetical protein
METALPGIHRRLGVPQSPDYETLRFKLSAPEDDETSGAAGKDPGIAWMAYAASQLSRLDGGAFMEAKRKANTSVVQRVLAPNQSK